MLDQLLYLWPTQDSGTFSDWHARALLYMLTRSRFAEKVLKAAKGESGIVEPSFVYLPGIEGGEAIAKETGCDFFSVPIELGVSLTITSSDHLLTFCQPDGAKKAHNVISGANDYEKKLLQACYTGLKGNISKGVEFVQSPPSK